MPTMKNKQLIASLLLLIAVNGYSAFADELTDTDEPVQLTDTTETDQAEKVFEVADETLYTEAVTLSPGLEYTRNIYNSNNYGIQREYILEYLPSETTVLNFMGNEKLYDTNVIENMAKEQYAEENFIAGINGDFFNMSTGVPESAFIKEYELYTTDRDSFCLAYSDTGEYFFDKPQIKLELLDENDQVINIAHLNKEFSEYALYLYNSKYSDTTHIKNSYSSAVLLPYDEFFTAEEIAELYKEDFELLGISDASSEEAVMKIEEFTGYKYINGVFYSITGIFPSIGYSENLVVYTVENDCKNGEIPENAYLLCGDNTSYGYIPAGMTPGDRYVLKITGNELYYNVFNAIGVGAIIVRDGETVNDTTLDHYKTLQPRSAVGIKADGSLVFYASDGRQKNKSAGLKLIDLAEKMKGLGCVYAANLDGGGSTAVFASRPGFDDASLMNTPSAGKQRSISNAFIFTNTLEKTDEAASAHVYGDSFVTYSNWLINIPEPIISDSLGFAYKKDEETEEALDVSFYTKDGTSSVIDGVLYPSGAKGMIDVFADVNGVASEKPAFSVYTVDTPDTIVLSADKKELAPYENANIDIKAQYKNLDIIDDYGCYVWSVKAGREDYATGKYGEVVNGIFTPFVNGEEFTITAARGEVSESITVKVDSYPFSDIENHWAVKEIYTLAKAGVVNGYPSETEGVFVYLPQRSYSRYEFCVMLERMTGIGSELDIAEDELSPTNESTDEMLDTEILSEDVVLTEDELDNRKIILDFADAQSIPDWAYDSVYRLYASGMLDKIMQKDIYGNVVFNGSDFITREDVMIVIGMLCESAPEDFSTDMYSDLTDEQKSNEFINNCLYSGIFSGYEDMTVRPYNHLTRAEAATVFLRLEKYLSETEF